MTPMDAAWAVLKSFPKAQPFSPESNYPPESVTRMPRPEAPYYGGEYAGEVPGSPQRALNHYAAYSPTGYDPEDTDHIMRILAATQRGYADDALREAPTGYDQEQYMRELERKVAL